jgi:hypothetical protein
MCCEPTIVPARNGFQERGNRIKTWLFFKKPHTEDMLFWNK